ncbi:MAG: alpha/beta fold hydrolase, partial [Actinomycetes bacterium]
MKSSALLGVAVLALTACAGTSTQVPSSGVGSPGSGSPSPSASGSSSPEPTSVTWAPCTEKELPGLECGTLVVPKNYSDPGAGTFSLAVVRAKATGPAAQRIGSLFFNPGGPGVSSVSLAPQVIPALPPQLRQRFDFVTWDPRGVGRSSGLTECKDATYELPATGAVDWNSVVDQMRITAKTSNQECAKRYPDVVPYISTNANARDLDRLRAAVGDAKLTYWGTSYGTRIG